MTLRQAALAELVTLVLGWSDDDKSDEGGAACLPETDAPAHDAPTDAAHDAMQLTGVKNDAAR
ncbi:MAG: hypothetical protein HY741_14060 [Chloroflexi bacterium]|nr:hypothetical protein [Chloroflexota bacterium]